MRDPGLRNRFKTEIQVGFFVLLSIVSLIAGIAWIAGLRIGGEQLRLYAVTSETTEVERGSRVLLLGVDIGEVTAVSLSSNSEVVVEMELIYGHRLPRDTRAEIRPAGLLSQVVELLPGTDKLALTDGDTIQGTRIPDLQSLAGDLGSQVADVLAQTQKLLSDEMVAGVQGGTQAMAATLGELESLIKAERSSLETLIESLAQASGQLAQATAGPELAAAVGRLDSLSARLTRATAGLDSTSQSLASIMAKVDQGRGTLGKLVNDTTLYGRLSGAAENLQAMTEEIALLMRNFRDQPERYLGELKISVF